ncbi:MAG TPA: pyridoxamine 5'-phosphate oxidase family protein [Patescibacteria group bacterium]|nr:pyridoxamine 5'-phosphate oxidase family protein [Patescibacteria group bacterium]
MDKVDKARVITKQNRYITIASTTLDGLPWISPVFYAYDDEYNLYWVSSKNARHSKNIEENPKVAIVIFNSTKGEGEGDAIYIDAEVKILVDDQEIEEGMKYYDARASKAELKVKNPENVKGEKEWRFYKAIPKAVYKSSDKPAVVNGQYVDKRTPVKLSDLQEVMEFIKK